MSLTRQELVDLALRYVPEEEITDFPMDGDLFCILRRRVPGNRVPKPDEGWQFGGYCLCVRYLLDDEAKPAGKWVWLEHVSLATFPPHHTSLKLQPPHIVKGSFHNPDRTVEFKIVKIVPAAQGVPSQEGADEPKERPGNVIAFPVRKSKSGGDDDGGGMSA